LFRILKKVDHLKCRGRILKLIVSYSIFEGLIATLREVTSLWDVTLGK
jgi:hypothetical protein